MFILRVGSDSFSDKIDLDLVLSAGTGQFDKKMGKTEKMKEGFNSFFFFLQHVQIIAWQLLY